MTRKQQRRQQALDEKHIRLRHIVVKTRAEAEAILQALRDGADFVTLAKQKSIDPNAAKGGDMGFFAPGDLNPAFELATSKLRVNEISEIVETAVGFHIFKRI